MLVILEIIYTHTYEDFRVGWSQDERGQEQKEMILYCSTITPELMMPGDVWRTSGVGSWEAGN